VVSNRDANAGGHSSFFRVGYKRVKWFRNTALKRASAGNSEVSTMVTEEMD
jgi:hypothetical protein